MVKKIRAGPPPPHSGNARKKTFFFREVFPNGANNPDNVERAGGQSGCFVRASLSQLSPTRVASNTSEGGENDQE